MTIILKLIISPNQIKKVSLNQKEEFQSVFCLSNKELDKAIDI